LIAAAVWLARPALAADPKPDATLKTKAIEASGPEGDGDEQQ